MQKDLSMQKKCFKNTFKNQLLYLQTALDFNMNIFLELIR